MALDWSTLPMDLLIVIVMKLETIEDFIYFSTVCRFWNDISSKIKHQWRCRQAPWLLLAENKTENPNCLRKIFNPSNNRCYHLNLPETFETRCWGTAYGWIVLIERDLNIRLFNPITKAQIRFPSTETIPNGGTNFHIKDVRNINWLLKDFFIKIIVLKVSQGDHDEFLIMAITQENLVFARHEDQSWTVLLTIVRRLYVMVVDIIAVDNKVFALGETGAIVYWNVKDLQMGKVIYPTDFAPSADYKVRGLIAKLNRGIQAIYLAQLDGDFIMILREKDAFLDEDDNETYETFGFYVFRLDPKGAWRQIEDLDGSALFVGCNSTMSISVTLAERLRPDCIYFTDDEYQFFTLPKEFGGDDMGIYDMKSKEIEDFYDGGDMRSSFCPPIWFIPQF